MKGWSLHARDLANSGLNRKVRDTVNYFLDEINIMNSIGMFRDSMWSGGQLRPPAAPRSAEEKAQARDNANRMLSALIPGMWSVFRMYRFQILIPV